MKEQIWIRMCPPCCQSKYIQVSTKLMRLPTYFSLYMCGWLAAVPVGVFTPSVTQLQAGSSGGLVYPPTGGVYSSPVLVSTAALGGPLLTGGAPIPGHLPYLAIPPGAASHLVSTTYLLLLYSFVLPIRSIGLSVSSGESPMFDRRWVIAGRLCMVKIKVSCTFLAMLCQYSGLKFLLGVQMPHKLQKYIHKLVLFSFCLQHFL